MVIDKCDRWWLTSVTDSGSKAESFPMLHLRHEIDKLVASQRLDMNLEKGSVKF